MKVVHIISGLNSGGAEGVLYRLICHNKSNTHYVISLTDNGFYGELLKKKNIYLRCLNLKKNFNFILIFFKLLILLKKINPEIVQCWMYHGDIYGGLAAKLLGKKKIFWNIRNSDLNRKWANKSTILIAKICSYLSYIIPYKIISCSDKSTETHVKLGYCKKKFFLINNGFDKIKFNYSKKFRNKWKLKLNINNKHVVFGFIGRWNSQKDFETLFIAFKNFLDSAKDSKNIKLLLVGSLINSKNKNLLKKLTKYNLLSNILLVDETTSVNEILNVIDLGIFTSKGNEGFPNVIAEKMLTKIPCIVANVGDASKIVGNNGWVYKKNNWIDLNKKINFVYKEFLFSKKRWNERKVLSRKRIINYFSIGQMIRSYNKAWMQ